MTDFINVLPTAKKALETADLFAKRDFLEKVGSNLKLKATDSDHKSQRKSQQATSLRCAKNSTIQSGGIEEKQGSRSINLQRANNGDVQLSVEFKNLWSILKIKGKKNGEIYNLLRVAEEVRTLRFAQEPCSPRVHFVHTMLSHLIFAFAKMADRLVFYPTADKV